MQRYTYLSLAAGVAMAFPVTALAEERVCRGAIGAITLDNVRVPQGARCTLDGTRVKGSIVVQRDAALIAEDVAVVGNVQAENHRSVTVEDGSRIGGSIQIKQGRAATVADVRVNGDIQYESNAGDLRIVRNRVGGSVQAFQNAGDLQIQRNTIDGNLQCKENRPAPVGGRNAVGGEKEDQCRRL